MCKRKNSRIHESDREKKRGMRRLKNDRREKARDKTLESRVSTLFENMCQCWSSRSFESFCHECHSQEKKSYTTQESTGIDSRIIHDSIENKVFLRYHIQKIKAKIAFFYCKKSVGNREKDAPLYSERKIDEKKTAQQCEQQIRKMRKKVKVTQETWAKYRTPLSACQVPNTPMVAMTAPQKSLPVLNATSAPKITIAHPQASALTANIILSRNTISRRGTVEPLGGVIILGGTASLGTPYFIPCQTGTSLTKYSTKIANPHQIFPVTL